METESSFDMVMRVMRGDMRDTDRELGIQWGKDGFGGVWIVKRWSDDGPTLTLHAGRHIMSSQQFTPTQARLVANALLEMADESDGGAARHDEPFDFVGARAAFREFIGGAK